MNHPLPRGWQEKTIGEIFQFIKNYTNSRAELNDYDEISYIHYGDMHKYYRHRIECDKIDFPKIRVGKRRIVSVAAFVTWQFTNELRGGEWEEKRLRS